MAFQREFVLVFAGNSIFLGNVFRGQAHVCVIVWQVLRKVWVGRKLISGHRHHRHRLRASGDGGFDLARLDRVGHMSNGLHA